MFEIGTSEQMQDIVTRASELGNILTRGYNRPPSKKFIIKRRLI